MKHYFKQGLSFLLYISCLLVFMPQATYADEGGAEIGYAHKVLKPDNQVSNVGYFDLRMTPSQKQTVEIELSNTDEKEVSINLSVNGAKTNSNGVIEYGPNKLKNDSSLKYDIKDVVKVEEKITLAPNETKKVPVEISMPQEKFAGYLSGGIYLQKSESKEEKKENEETAGVANKYAFIVGILLSEEDKILQPELSFNKIYAGSANYRNTFIINYSNIEATYVEGMTVDAQIFKKGSDEVLYESKKENYRMAPNSSIAFPINLNGESFSSGDYIGHILVTIGDKKWEWKEEFTVTQKEADKYNAKDVSLIQSRGINWKLIVMIAGGILGALLIIYLLVRLTSNKKKNKQRKNMKKQKR